MTSRGLNQSCAFNRPAIVAAVKIVRARLDASSKKTPTVFPMFSTSPRMRPRRFPLVSRRTRCISTSCLVLYQICSTNLVEPSTTNLVLTCVGSTLCENWLCSTLIHSRLCATRQSTYTRSILKYVKYKQNCIGKSPIGDYCSLL